MPGKGTKRQSIRIDEDLWTEYERVAVPSRSEELRAFIEWRVGRRGAKLPGRRPRKKSGSPTQTVPESATT